MSLFRSQAIGRLTKDPVLRRVEINGEQVSVCEFSIAVNYGFGQNRKTEYIDCVAWRRLAEIIANYFKKGRKIYVEGRQQTRKFTIEKDGVTFMTQKTEWIIDDFDFCDSEGGPQAQQVANAQQAGNVSTQQNVQSASTIQPPF